MPESSALEAFRDELRAWIAAHCPPSLRAETKRADAPATAEDRRAWLRAMADRGYTTPDWPREYGGGGLSKEEARILKEELARAGTYSPEVCFFGTTMLGPVLLEFGNEEQKKDHLPRIARGEIRWCQGYSEPGSGSDLASLQTRAVLEGDHYVVNGSKIWTTGANKADWIFCLVRTDPSAPKHEGISFLLFDLRVPGVTISPIRLISGESDFCQVFFENVRADPRNLVGSLNGGWTIAKRLLQHERQMLSSGVLGSLGTGEAPAPAKARTVEPVGSSLAERARRYLGEENGRLADPCIRDRIAQYELDALCFDLTMKRSGEAARSGQGPGAATSMFKLYASELNQRRTELLMTIRGADGLGWSGDGFSPEEILETRAWLRSKGNSIEGGTSEIQRNVIAKRVLGLPD